MDAVGVVASIVLGALFLLAGASKIAAGHSWAAQARGLGAPVAVIPIVPWAEILVGAALVSQLAPIPAALAAIVLLIAFTALIGVQLAKGRRPPCACFGAWSAKPIGVGHLLRNGAMLALACVVALA